MLKPSPLQVYRNTVTGQTFHGQVVQRVPEKNPLQKKQWVKVVAIIKPATFTQKAVIETELYFLPFMEAAQKAEARWPGKRLSYTTLQVVAAQKEPVSAAKEKAE